MGKTYEIKPVPGDEANLFYANAGKEAERGCIGYLRADFGGNGKEFWTTWNDHCKDLKTQAFKDELNEVIDHLRERGNMLDGYADTPACQNSASKTVTPSSARDTATTATDSGSTRTATATSSGGFSRGAITTSTALLISATCWSSTSRWRGRSKRPSRSKPPHSQWTVCNSDYSRPYIFAKD